MELQYDEYGVGDPARLHAELFARGMEASGLRPEHGAYVDESPPRSSSRTTRCPCSACSAGSGRGRRAPGGVRGDQLGAVAAAGAGARAAGLPGGDRRLLPRARGGRRGARAGRAARHLREPGRRRSRASSRTCGSAPGRAWTSRTGPPAGCWRRGGCPHDPARRVPVSRRPDAAARRPGGHRRRRRASTGRPGRSRRSAAAASRRPSRGATAPTSCCRPSCGPRPPSAATRSICTSAPRSNSRTSTTARSS